MKRINFYLVERYQTIISYIGLILIFNAALLLTPLLILPFFPQELKYSTAFISASAMEGLLGLLLRGIAGSRKGKSLNLDESGIAIFIAWIIFSIFSGLPYMKLVNLNFSQAVFEAVSGYTTTGLSMVNVETAPNLVLIWRSITQFVGGAGMAIIMIAAITGVAGAGLYVAEGKGSQAKPHVKDSAQIVMTLYSGYAVIGIIAYKLVGMTWFDSINHCFAAIATGGFSTHTANIGYWDSAPIEAVSIALMIMGNMNFVTMYWLVQGKLKSVIRNGEIKVLLTALPFCILLVFLCTTQYLYPTLSKQVRVAAFESVSCITGTGFSTVGYNNWNDMGLFVLTVLMVLGGGTCSTSGGLKQYRVYLAFKSILWQIKRSLLPAKACVQNFIWDGDSKLYINDTHIKLVFNMIILYLFTFFTGSMIFMMHGYSMQASFFEFASALGTVGVSMGVTKPDMPLTAMWTATVGMYLGRLEFFIIFAGIWKIASDAKKFIKY